MLSIFSLSVRSKPGELILLLNISLGNCIFNKSFFSNFDSNTFAGFSANFLGSTSESRSLFINELFAPFSNNLLTR